MWNLESRCTLKRCLWLVDFLQPNDSVHLKGLQMDKVIYYGVSVNSYSGDLSSLLCNFLSFRQFEYNALCSKGFKIKHKLSNLKHELLTKGILLSE